MKTKKQNIKIDLNKWLIIGLSVLIFLVILFLISKIRLATSQERENKYTFREDKLILIKKDNKYGYINRNGKVVVEPQYEFAYENTGKYYTVEKDSKYYLLDNNGKVKLESNMAISYNKDYDLYITEYKLYNSNLNKISPDKLVLTHSGAGYYRFVSEDGETAGIINSAGKITYKQKISKGQSMYVNLGEVDIDQKEVYCSISPDGTQYALINCNTGKMIENYSSAVITAQGNNIFTIGQGSLSKDKTVYVSNNKYALEVESETKVVYYPSGYIEYQVDGVKKYLNTKTNKTLETQPDDLYDSNKQNEFENKTGYTKIACNRKYGLIDSNKVLIPCEYDSIVTIPYKVYTYLKSIGKNLTIGVKNNKTYIINTNNNKIVHKLETTKTINTSASSPFVYFYEDENNAVVYNLANNKEIKIEAEKIEAYGNYIKAHIGKKIVYYNRDLKKIYELENEE